MVLIIICRYLTTLNTINDCIVFLHKGYKRRDSIRSHTVMLQT